MLARYGFTTPEEIAAVPDLGLLNIRHFGPKTRLVVDAVLAAYRLVDDPAIRAAQERRRHHITSRLSAAHRARNAALLDLLAICDLEIGAVDTILESLAAEVVPPADPRLLQLLGAAGQPELAALYARTRTPPPATDGPRGSSHDRHTSSGDTDRDVDRRAGRTIADPVSAPPIRDGRRVLGHEHAGADCVSEASETLGWTM